MSAVIYLFMKIEMQRRGVTTLVHKKSWQILGMGPLAWIQSVVNEFIILIHLPNGRYN